MDELMMRERLYLQESMDNAIMNAYKKAGKEINIKQIINNVSYISEESKTDLKVGDQIISVNGKSISSLAELKEIVEQLSENEKVNLKIKRKDNAVIPDSYRIILKDMLEDVDVINMLEEAGIIEQIGKVYEQMKECLSKINKNEEAEIFTFVHIEKP